MPQLSKHFHSREFACHHCGQTNGPPAVVLANLEHLRSHVGRPLIVVSGYRCAIHNRAVGGARRSRHLFGDAVDLKLGYATVAQAKHAGFVGIGYRGVWAVHVDMRSGPPVVFKD